MDKFLLKSKWIGALALLIFCVCYSLYWKSVIQLTFAQIREPILTTAADFLPITFEGGMIEKPQNVLIEKSYVTETGTKELKIVLDTRAEELEPSLLGDGIYISRKAVYVVDKQKGDVRIRSLENMPDMTIDKQSFAEIWSFVEQKIISYSFFIIFGALLVMSWIIIGLVSLVCHLIMLAMSKASYPLTLRISTYSYLLVMLVNAINIINSLFLPTLIIAIIANILLNNVEKARE